MSAGGVFGIGFLVALATFALVGRFALFGKSADEKLVARAKERGWMTTAIAADSFRDHYNPARSRPGVMDSAAVVYEYHVGGKRYTSNQYFEDAAGVVDYPLETVAYYDANNPKRHVLACQDLKGARGKRGCLITFATALAAYILVVNVLASVFGVDILAASYG